MTSTPRVKLEEHTTLSNDTTQTHNGAFTPAQWTCVRWPFDNVHDAFHYKSICTSYTMLAAKACGGVKILPFESKRKVIKPFIAL